MSIIFGPVLSRRFGNSLGIDLSPLGKQCNFDCLYCELKGAKTTNLFLNYPSIEDIVSEAKTALKRFENINVITLTANGEPTLYPLLEELVYELNKIKQNKKLLILSNGSTIDNQVIQNALLGIDIVKLSLDSVNQTTFRKLDRPHKDIKLENIINGMKEFRLKFTNEFVLEILVVENLNDKQEEFKQLNSVINQIRPERVDIGTIDRPSAYKVNPVSYDKLKELSLEIYNIPVVISKRDLHVENKKTLTKKEILLLLSKRPQSEDDVKNLFTKDSQKHFQELLNEKKVELIKVANINFYKIL